MTYKDWFVITVASGNVTAQRGDVLTDWEVNLAFQCECASA